MKQLQQDLQLRETEKMALAQEVETLRRTLQNQEKDSELERLRLQTSNLEKELVGR